MARHPQPAAAQPETTDAGDTTSIVPNAGDQPAAVQPEVSAEEAQRIAAGIMKTADASFARRTSGHMLRVRCLDALGQPLTNGSCGTSFGTYDIGADGIAVVPGEAWDAGDFRDAQRFQVIG